MNNNLKIFVFAGLFILSGILGSATAMWLRLPSQSVAAGEIPEQPPGKLVQESRSSYRPDYRGSSLGRSGFNRSLYNRRTSPRVLTAMSESTDQSWKASVRVLAENEQVALGMIVDSAGWIITKASQLPSDKKLKCRLFDYRELAAERIATIQDLDIALLRIPASELPTAQWSTAIPTRGSFVATIDVKATPASLGVVSTGVQRVPEKRSVLGVTLTNSSEGATVTHVLLGTGAYDAGFRIGDNIFEVNDVPVQTLGEFKRVIRSAKGGDSVNVRMTRGESELAISAKLMDLSEELLDDTEMEVNGRVSARATGFNRVFLHDTVLEPNQCGGPLINLDGQVVGLNIARAGRVTSYAIPGDVIQPAVRGLIEEAKLVSKRTGDSSSSRASKVR
ncbi:MAG: PDZ domain-containing protein [Pirellulaceae bacterium]